MSIMGVVLTCAKPGWIIFKGQSQCAIARSCQVARSTVQDYLRRARAKHLQYADITGLSDSEIKRALGKGKIPQASPISDDRLAQVSQALGRKGVTLVLLWQEGLDAGEWTCSYGSFCRHYKQWRGQQHLSLRQVYQGGDKLFVDYCGVTVTVQSADGASPIEAQIFVACLGASNYTYAEATASQNLQDWLGSHQRTFEFLGGVPACVVPDNLKSGVSAACHYEPGVNRSYQAFGRTRWPGRAPGPPL
jgi:transposase